MRLWPEFEPRHFACQFFLSERKKRKAGALALQNPAIDLGKRRPTKKSQRDIDFIAQDLECAFYPGLLARSETVKPRTTDHAGLCAERACPDDVGTTADAAVEDHLQFVAHGLRDFG